ncbi:unnamed protein product [Dracunculus medinensis]|uniref:Transmembrane protein n=1 Tax=Dracunculus medinensis TaxID=318479 RepID=A0A0N4U868_DRAME|nr:unnamed protein product [Dracunculus medinensis]
MVVDRVISVLNSANDSLVDFNETSDNQGALTVTTASTSESIAMQTLTSTMSVMTTSLTNQVSSNIHSVQKINDSDSSFFTLAIFSSVLFVISVLLILKIVASYNKKRRSIISGSRVQWRLTNFSQNRHGQGTTQNVYSAMPNEGSIFSSLDVPHPDARLDWERQFFDENLDNPPNWEFQPRTPSRLRLDSDRLRI